MMPYTGRPYCQFCSTECTDDSELTRQYIPCPSSHHNRTFIVLWQALAFTSVMATITQRVHSKFAQALAIPLPTEALVVRVQEPKADLTLIDITLDEVRPDEVLVEIKYSGICHTVRIHVSSFDIVR